MVHPGGIVITKPSLVKLGLGLPPLGGFVQSAGKNASGTLDTVGDGEGELLMVVGVGTGELDPVLLSTAPHPTNSRTVMRITGAKRCIPIT